MTPARSTVIILALLVAACGGETGTTTTSLGDLTTSTSPATSTTQPPASTSTTGATTTTPAEEAGVHVAETALGEILVDPEGFTLYIFTVDSEGESACYDACAELWPPVDASTPIDDDLDAALFGSTTRTDGTAQLTIAGMPLYRYTPDTTPGDVNGQGFNGVWFVVDAAGNVIEASVDDVALDYGY